MDDTGRLRNRRRRRHAHDQHAALMAMCRASAVQLRRTAWRLSAAIEVSRQTVLHVRWARSERNYIRRRTRCSAFYGKSAER